MAEEPYGWNSLSPDVRVHILKFLSVKERAVAETASKRTRKECIDAILVFPAIQNGVLPKALGDPFGEILNVGCYAAYDMGVANTLSRKAAGLLNDVNDFKKLWENRMLEDIMGLSRDMFGHWDYNYTGLKGSGCFAYIQAQADRDAVHGGNPYELAPHMSQILHWSTSRVSGKMYILLGRPDGTVVVSGDLKTVLLVQGIMGSLAGMVSQGGFSLPSQVLCTLLPFHGYIANDDLLGQPRTVHPAFAKQLFRLYAEAVDSGTLVTSLPTVHRDTLATPPPPPTAALLTSPTTPTMETLLFMPGHADVPGNKDKLSALISRAMKELSKEQRVELKRLKTAEKIPLTVSTCPLLPHERQWTDGRRINDGGRGQEGCWGFYRVGFTLPRNPLCQLVVRTGKGRVVASLRTAAICPTALEIFDMLCGLAGEGSLCPSIVGTDEISAVQGLKALLLLTGIKVTYFPPPLKEEAFPMRGVDVNCAHCGISESELSLQERSPLLRCTRCKDVVYCSRECQKAHWPLHKKKCAK